MWAAPVGFTVAGTMSGGERVGAVLIGLITVLGGVLLIKRRESFAADMARSASQFRSRNADRVFQAQLRLALIVVPIGGAVFVAGGLLVAWTGLRG